MGKIQSDGAGASSSSSSSSSRVDAKMSKELLLARADSRAIAQRAL